MSNGVTLSCLVTAMQVDWAVCDGTEWAKGLKATEHICKEASGKNNTSSAVVANAVSAALTVRSQIVRA